MLKLVHPAREGQDGGDPPRKRKRPRRIPQLTPDESRHLQTATRNLHKAFGSSWPCLSAVTGVAACTLEQIGNGRSRGSVAVALFVARAAGVSVECLLSGKLTDMSKCPACGRKMPPALAAGGAS